MNQVRYFNFLNKFYPKGLDIFGIILIPTSIDYSHKITFKIKNPKDLSYTQPCLYGYTQDKLKTFHDIVGVPTHGNQYGNFIIDSPSIHVNEELFNDTEKLLIKKHRLLLPKRKQNDDVIIFDIEHVDFKYEIVRNEEIMLTNFVKVNKVEDALDPTKKMNIIDSIKKYEQFTYHYRFDDSETNYIEIDNLFDRHPTFQDKDWQVNLTVTEFVI